MISALLLVVSLGLAAEPAAAPAAPAAEVKSSTPTPTVGSIYTVERMRDPFIPGGLGGGPTALKPFTPQDFNIHNLTLKGIMKDGPEYYAMLYDTEFGVSFILRRGRVIDPKGKSIPNVKGRIVARERTVKLEGLEGDVQVLRLGKTDEEEEGK